MDLSGEGFGDPATLATVAGVSPLQPTLRVDTLLFEPAVVAVTLVAAPMNHSDPSHVAIQDTQVLSLTTALNNFEVQRVRIVSPGFSGGGFRLTSTDGLRSTGELSFLVTNTSLALAVLSLNLVAEVSVDRVRVTHPNGTEELTWDITFLELVPIGLLNIVTENLLFPDVTATVVRVQFGVSPLSGTFRLSIPGLFFGPSIPIPFDAGEQEMELALESMPHPARYIALEVASIRREEVHRSEPVFAGAGFVSYLWHVAFLLKPFEGVDPRGQLTPFTADLSSLVGGRAVDVVSQRVVVGQAGRQDVAGFVAASVEDGTLAASNHVVVSLPVTSSAVPSSIMAALAGLPAVEVLGLEVLVHDGGVGNDNGFGVHTGYGVGHNYMLQGIGRGYTWIFRYIPRGMVTACMKAGSMDTSPQLVFKFDAVTGTDVSTRWSQLRPFRCSAVEGTVKNHTNVALRVHLAALGDFLPGALEYYNEYQNVVRPAGLWRSLHLDAFGTTTVAAFNQGWFVGVDGVAVGDVTSALGFAAVDPDTAFRFGGTTGSYLSIPFR